MSLLKNKGLVLLIRQEKYGNISGSRRRIVQKKGIFARHIPVVVWMLRSHFIRGVMILMYSPDVIY